MKRFWYLLIVVAFATSLACAQDQGVSLGDAARNARQGKSTAASPNAKVYDNDNLPRNATLSTTSGDFGGIAPSKDDKDSKDAKAGKPGAKDAKTPDEAAQAQADDFKSKVADAKKNIEQLTREIDVMQREQRLRSAAFYGDAGNKVRPENMAKYQADTQQYNDDLKAKQDALSQAKQDLDNLREQIRQAGLPASLGE
ncbi:MAG TPA: hypothetical protein VL382_00630 [Terriglobales bacterium]|nr:hypothetical protein [Terriglobales bacterium]